MGLLSNRALTGASGTLSALSRMVGINGNGMSCKLSSQVQQYWDNGNLKVPFLLSCKLLNQIEVKVIVDSKQARASNLPITIRSMQAKMRFCPSRKVLA